MLCLTEFDPPGVAQVLYSRGLRALLSTWSMDGLQSLSSIAHKLGFASTICQAVEAAALKQLDVFQRMYGSSTHALELLVWADDVHFIKLRSRLIRAVADARGEQHWAALSKDLLILLVRELKQRELSQASRLDFTLGSA